jgi:hypothetical protein
MTKSLSFIRFFLNKAQRDCVWLVALARTKLTKENEPEEIPLGISK